MSKGKVRLIDDFTAGRINELVAAQEMVDMRGVDEIVNIAKAWCTAVDSSGTASVTPASG